ncbi:AbrB/MazE/SpoVT family DNA-binding domain-containing protein [Aestuariivirga sp.]|uniref:AbrB/MazE/SpoVT family DNA-binding domain-containing protein n=1 Tax=Aestuariivirga sp. TaxID=2650926 RepID=UPI0039E6630F
MRITSKGQVTIPKEVRDQAGIDQKSDLEIAFRNGEVVIRKRPDDDNERDRRKRQFRDWLAGAAGVADGEMTADEILEDTRGPFNDLDPR